jgi:alanyl-tRNA synthetase
VQAEATFTQADVDRIVGERAKRAQEAAINKMLTELGFERPDDLKALVTDAKKRKDAEMSELEKAQVAIDAANKKAKEAEDRYQQAQQEMLNRERKQAFLKATRDSGGSNPDDLFILVQAKHQSEFVSVFGDDAIPDESKMKTFMKQVQSSFPAYFGTSGAGSPSNSNGVAPTSQQETEKTVQQMTAKFGKM